MFVAIFFVESLPPTSLQRANLSFIVRIRHNYEFQWEQWRHMTSWILVNIGSGGRFKNAYELLTLRALKTSMLNIKKYFNVWVGCFVWNFKGTLWNSTQNILPIHWKMCILFTSENLRAHKCFWNAPLDLSNSGGILFACLFSIFYKS